MYKSPCHNTFRLGEITIDSNFDSGNCISATKQNQTTINVWIGCDHRINNYRTWFYFSAEGVLENSTIRFVIKNMQNHSKLLYEGLVPVYREEGAQQWTRINQKINLTKIQYYQTSIQWQFYHTFLNKKVFFAIFYPWSVSQNCNFLNEAKQTFSQRSNIYFHRSTIISSLEGRPVEMITLSSIKGITNQSQKINDKYLFVNSQIPKSFKDKPSWVISARVHPGEVPGSHVFVGILKTLMQQCQISKLLLDEFVFYFFPILNPDGVFRGHYRTDSKGLNLNRFYINPSPTNHSSIYALKKMIIYLNDNHRFYGFLDLHAHAGRNGMFIYGNAMNQLEKQIQTCLFPKILSLNSQDFEYEGSNFTQQNMYLKDKYDSISKQGSGRVAIYKATKNSRCWTLQCNYNGSKIHNVLQPQKKNTIQCNTVDDNIQINRQLILKYRYPIQKQSKKFYTIQTYHKLGKEICQSFLDLIKKNPISRIQNINNHFKSFNNLKLNLAVALMRMAPNRFQQPFKKIHFSLNSDNDELINRSLKALQLIVIHKTKIQNINQYLKSKNNDVNIITQNQKKITTMNMSVRYQSNSVSKNIRISKLNGRGNRSTTVTDPQNNIQDYISIQSIKEAKLQEKMQFQIQNSNIQKFKQIFMKKIILKIQEQKIIGMQSLKSSMDNKIQTKNSLQNYYQSSIRKNMKAQMQRDQVKYRGNGNLMLVSLTQKPKLIKGISARNPFHDF